MVIFLGGLIIKGYFRGLFCLILWFVLRSWGEGHSSTWVLTAYSVLLFPLHYSLSLLFILFMGLTFMFMGLLFLFISMYILIVTSLLNLGKNCITWSSLFTQGLKV